MASGEPAVDTDVLVVGSGPRGAGAALFLATCGTRTLVVTKYGRLSDTPRAHITNQRTMEVLEDLGVADAVIAEATPRAPDRHDDVLHGDRRRGAGPGPVLGHRHRAATPRTSSRARRASATCRRTSWNRSW